MGATLLSQCVGFTELGCILGTPSFLETRLFFFFSRQLYPAWEHPSASLNLFVVSPTSYLLSRLPITFNLCWGLEILSELTESIICAAVNVGAFFPFWLVSGTTVISLWPLKCWKSSAVDHVIDAGFCWRG